MLYSQKFDTYICEDKRFSRSDLATKTVRADFTPQTRLSRKSAQEYPDGRFKNRPRLSSLQIEITGRCNERCVHCYIPRENKTGDISPGLFRETLEQSRDIGVLNLTLSGGEPMLHKNFCEFLEKATEYGFKISIFSNLTLINDKIVEALKKSNVKTLQASVYSLDAQIHDAITNLSGSLEKTIKNIKRLIDEQIPLFISCPIMKENKNSYIDVLKWAKSLGIGCAPTGLILSVSDFSLSNLRHRQSIDEALNLISSILENDEEAYKHGRFSPHSAHVNNFQEQFIDVYRHALAVNAGGNLIPAAAWNYVLGNLNENTLSDILENSSELKKLLNLTVEDFPKCKNCVSAKFCGMCLGANANDNSGDYLKIPDYVCELADKTRKLVHNWWTENNYFTKEG